MIPHIKNGNMIMMVIKIKAHQTVAAPSHQKTYGFLREKKKEKWKLSNILSSILLSFTAMLRHD